MTAGAQKDPDSETASTTASSATNGLDRSFKSGPSQGGFFLGLLSVMAALVVVGVGGFWTLTANSPLTLLSGGDRPIAAATAFIPNSSPFTLSLLTKPDKLVGLQQALIAPDERQQAEAEIAQLKQAFFSSTGLDYDQDVQSWIGNEVTFALTDRDLDIDSANGRQPGYLLAIDIASDRSQAAQAFLQRFWLQQSLAGNEPMSERISGVRILYSPPTSLQTSPHKLTAASALVGDQFVIFSNDVRAIKHSIRAAQTATNLAQNPTYRQAVSQLDEQRLGLMYLDTTALMAPKTSSQDSETSDQKTSDKPLSPHFIAIGLNLSQDTAAAGLIADIQLPPDNNSLRKSSPASQGKARAAERTLSEAPRTKALLTEETLLTEALSFLPATSALVLEGQNINTLAPSLKATGMTQSALPDFLKLGLDLGLIENSDDKTRANKSRWQRMLSLQLSQSPSQSSSNAESLDGPLWPIGSYVLGQLGSGDDDWILAIEPDVSSLEQLDKAAIAQGYSVVPVSIGEVEATAWTRFEAKKRGRRSSGGLETEVLALHLQQTTPSQQRYEIFASSLAAMESALESHQSQSSLLSSEPFEAAIAPVVGPNANYFYADWRAIAPAIRRTLTIVSKIETQARPLVAHLNTLSATREGNHAEAFIQLTDLTSKWPSKK
ncbi:MAG: DUF3352 domain-containing protein [Cyanobacteria bacterium J06634_5]